MPLYGAYCLGVSKTTFYPPILKSVLSLGIVLPVGAIFISFIQSNTWILLALNALIVCILTAIINSFVILQKQDLQFVKSKILKV